MICTIAHFGKKDWKTLLTVAIISLVDFMPKSYANKIKAHNKNNCLKNSWSQYELKDDVMLLLVP